MANRRQISAERSQRRQGVDRNQSLAKTLLGILDSLPGGVSLVDAGLRYLYVNEALAAWYAVPAESVIGRRLGDVLPPETMAVLHPALARVLAGESVSLEEHLAYPDGRTRRVRIEYRPQRDAEGNVWGFVSLLNDITRRHEAEQALHRSERQHREAEKIAGLGHWRWVAGADRDWSGGRHILSHGAAAIYGLPLSDLGYTTEDLLSRSVYPDDRMALAELYADVQRRRAPGYVVEYRLMGPMGEVRHVREAAENVFDAAGDYIEAFGTVLDITALKEAENRLREREAHYRQAERIARLGHWHWRAGPDGDWSGGIYTVSDSAATIYGHAADTLGVTTDELIDRTTHPDDLPELRRFFARIQAARQRDYTVEYRLVHPDGRILHVRESAENVFDDTGAMIESFGIVQDITAEKETELALRLSETRLKHAQRIGNIGSWEWDFLADELTWSDQTFHLYGLKPGEMAPHDAFTGMLDAATVARLETCFERMLQNGAPYSVDYPIARADGEIRILHEEAEIQRDAAGRPVSVVGTAQDVTEQRRQEQALRANQDLLEIGQRLANMGSFDWDLRTDRIRWSEQLWRICRLAPREFAPTIEENLSQIHPGDRALFGEAVARLVERGESYEIDYRLIWPDGEMRAVHEIATATLGADGRPERAFGSTQDVTEWRLAEAALLESEARLREAQRLARMGSWEWNLVDDSVLRSEGYVQLFGMGSDALGAERGLCLAFVHPDDRARLADALAETSRTGGEYKVDFRIVRADGAERILHETWLVHADAAGRPLRMTGIAQDVTEQRRLEHDLTQARFAADLASMRKTTYLANMSHELRTPLNAIIGFTDLLAHGIAGELKPKQAEYIGDVHGAAQHLKDVINDVLDLSKIEAGQFELDERPLRIGEVVTHCLDLVRYQVQAKKLALSVELAPGLPALRADEMALKKILVNLLSNAVKFTPAGGAVRLAAGLGADGGLLIEIRDSGIGIAAKDLERVMLPFSQAEGGRSGRQEGTGLGLAISRGLAERHGGSLTLASALGRGTTATLTLPSWRLA